jgi:hypothetical protein
MFSSPYSLRPFLPAHELFPYSLIFDPLPLNCRLIPQFPHTIHGANSTRREADKTKTVRNITVAVSDDLYSQTRRLAAQYDTTVTNMVRFLSSPSRSGSRPRASPVERPSDCDFWQDTFAHHFAQPNMDTDELGSPGTAFSVTVQSQDVTHLHYRVAKTRTGLVA